jgi:hypothetical protein
MRERHHMSQDQSDSDATLSDVPPVSPEVMATGQMPGSLGIIPDALEETIIATAVRLLRSANRNQERTPVEAAIFKGAGQMFEELAAACRELSGEDAPEQRRAQKSTRKRSSGGLQ